VGPRQAAYNREARTTPAQARASDHRRSASDGIELVHWVCVEAIREDNVKGGPVDSNVVDVVVLRYHQTDERVKAAIDGCGRVGNEEVFGNANSAAEAEVECPRSTSVTHCTRLPFVD
jgi:hypothetical protein